EEGQRAQLERDQRGLHARMISQAARSGHCERERAQELLGIGAQLVECRFEPGHGPPQPFRRDAGARDRAPRLEQWDETGALARTERRLERLEQERIAPAAVREAQEVAELRDAILVVERREQRERRVQRLLRALGEALAQDRERLAVERAGAQQVGARRLE